MPIDVPTPDRIPMSQRERDVLKIMHAVLKGDRTQAEAARLLGLSTRQVRRIQRKLEATGDEAVVHGLRGRPSNHRPDPSLKRSVWDAHRARCGDYGPTFVSDQAPERGSHVPPP